MARKPKQQAAALVATAAMNIGHDLNDPVQAHALADWALAQFVGALSHLPDNRIMSSYKALLGEVQQSAASRTADFERMKARRMGVQS